MAEKSLNTRIQQKHDTQVNWEKATGFIPKAGEIIVYDADENYSYPRIKIGNGEATVSELPFVANDIVIVNFTSDSEGNCIPDKTFFEVAQAYSEGKMIYACVDDGFVIPIMGNFEETIIFSSTLNSNGEIGAAMVSWTATNEVEMRVDIIPKNGTANIIFTTQTDGSIIANKSFNEIYDLLIVGELIWGLYDDTTVVSLINYSNDVMVFSTTAIPGDDSVGTIYIALNSDNSVSIVPFVHTPMYVIINQNADGTTTASATYEEIAAAINTFRQVYCIINGTIIVPLASFADSNGRLLFSAIFTFDKTFINYQVNILSDNTVTVEVQTTLLKDEYPNPYALNINGTIYDGSNTVTITDLATQSYVTNAIAAIDYPVDSVNGKTGVVSLTASDVGALPDTTVIPSIEGLASETYVNDAISNIDYPVVSVNGKKGVVSLTASDVGALPNTTVIPSIEGLATETYVNEQVAALIDSSPDTLNTLNELAAALGDDPNFATTIANQIGNKVDKTTTVNGKALSDNITLSANDIGALPDTTEIPSIDGLATIEGVINNEYTTFRAISTDGISYTATIDGLVELVAGTLLVMVPSRTSASRNTVNLNINGLGAKTIYRETSGALAYGASADWLSAGRPYIILYKGSYWTVINLPKISASDLDGSVPIANGGTGATDAATARSNLGITPANIGAATTTDITNALSPYAKKTEVPSIEGLATTADITNALSPYAKKTEVPSIEGLATETYVNEAIEAIPEADLSDYYTKAQTTTQINNAISAIDFPVTSVNGKTGTVSLNANDVGADAAGTATREISYLNIQNGNNSSLRFKWSAEDDTEYAIGYNAIALGNGVKASGVLSYACGNSTTASGGYAYAEGNQTVSSGNASHAEGSYSIANGGSSHAEGLYTIASGDYQHVQGRYNIEDTAGKYTHIVGNGTSGTARSNAHTVDWNGLGWYAGGLKVGGTGQDDAAAVSVLTTNDLVAITNDEIDSICGASIVAASEVAY